MFDSDIERQAAALTSEAARAVELSLKAMEASTHNNVMAGPGWNFRKLEEALRYAQIASEYRRLADLAGKASA